MKEKLVVILGPTATGKSRAGVMLAEKIGSEVVSGDSMLIYKGLDIGTAKPDKAQQKNILHHLIDIVEPWENFSAAAFQQRAARAISEVNSKGKVPILVGGTGLYIKSLLEGYEFSSAGESGLRRGLCAFAEKNGNYALWEKLQALDAALAAQIHPNNRQRVARALEVAMSGNKLSRGKQDGLVYDAMVFGLDMQRTALYARINQRVEEMFRQGLVKEVEGLVADGLPVNVQSLRGIGYKEVIDYLAGNIGLDACRELVARNTRRFAKRQGTWYKSMPYIDWHEVTDSTDWDFLVNIMQAKLVERFKLR